MAQTSDARTVYDLNQAIGALSEATTYVRLNQKKLTITTIEQTIKKLQRVLDEMKP